MLCDTSKHAKNTRALRVSCKTWNLESGILESWNPGILESSRLQQDFSIKIIQRITSWEYDFDRGYSN